MTYEISLNLSEILRTTLYLVEHTNYPGKDTPTVLDLKKCLKHAISELEIMKDRERS